SWIDCTYNEMTSMKKRLGKLLTLLGLYGLAVNVVRSLRWLSSAEERTRRRQEYAEKRERDAERLENLRFYQQFYSQFIKTGDLCFDIGANVGDRTEVFSKLGANTIAVEPQDSCIECLRRRFRTDRKTSIVQTALGKSEGRAEMMLSNYH